MSAPESLEPGPPAATGEVVVTATGVLVNVKPAGAKGLGAFVLDQEVPVGAFLALYGGELIDEEELERRYGELERQGWKQTVVDGPSGGYVFGLSGGFSIDAEDPSLSNW